MKTTFTIKMWDSAVNEWDVDLGADILNGMTDDEVKDCARAAKVVKVQARLRGNKKVEDSATSIERFLKGIGFANAIVEVAVPKVSKPKMTSEEVLAEILSGKRELTDEQKAMLRKLTA